jgi:hypothetical protein
MRTITKSACGSPSRSGMSATTLVTLAGAMALVVLALSATRAQRWTQMYRIDEGDL